MRPYSNDYSQHVVADLFGVSPATVPNIVRRQRETGSPDTLPHGGGRTRTLAQPVHDRVRQLFLRRNDMTLAELCEQIAQEYKTRVSVSTMCRLLQHLGLPHKTRHSTPPNAIRPVPNKHV